MTVELEFIPATEADSDRISDIVMGVPDQLTTRVAMRVLGIRDFEKARRLWRVINRREEAWRSVTLAKSDGETVGVLMTSPLDISISFALLARALLLFGPLWLIRVPGRMKLQGRVHAERVEGAFNVSEMHVAPEARGLGIGTALLGEAERQARDGGYDTMSLQVLTANPAVRLYKRSGFEIVSTTTDPKFEALTGVSGNHRMVKRLA